MPCSVRVLGLGNEILGDDAVGILVARQVAECFPPEEVEVVSSSESGLHLLEYLTDCSRLIVVDSVQTGRAAPGAIFAVREADVRSAAGSTPHGTGVFDALALARTLGFTVPEDVVIFGIETADCLTLGGEMHPAVAAAIPAVVERVLQIIPAPARSLAIAAQ